MPAGFFFLRSRMTADLHGWFISTRDTDAIAVLLVLDIFLIAALLVYKDRICSLTPLTLHLFSHDSDLVLFQKRERFKVSWSLQMFWVGLGLGFVLLFFEGFGFGVFFLRGLLSS